jgi:predicted ribosomally synthesized peptide with SipW-like signal peptide
MMMGAGYAYWTDTVTINNIVETGEMKVVFTAANAVNAGSDDYQVSTGSLVGTDGKTATYSVTNMYPGAMVNYSATVKNDGTIPAVIGGITLTEQTNLTAEEKGFFLVSGTVKNGATTLYTLPVGTTLANLNNVLQAVGFRIEPQASVIVEIQMLVDPVNVTGDMIEEKEISNTMTFNFKQHNQ